MTPKAVQNAPRQRVLSDDELATIWNALDDGDDYAALVRLLILTGARRDEIARLRWRRPISTRRSCACPAREQKTAKPHNIPLSPQAVAIFGRAACRRAAIRLRHQRQRLPSISAARGPTSTGCSVAHRPALDPAGFSPNDQHAAARRAVRNRAACRRSLFGHISGHRSGVAGTYNRARLSARAARGAAALGRAHRGDRGRHRSGDCGLGARAAAAAASSEARCGCAEEAGRGGRPVASWRQEIRGHDRTDQPTVRRRAAHGSRACRARQSNQRLVQIVIA